MIYAGLFCLTRGAAKAEPANQPRVHLTIFVLPEPQPLGHFAEAPSNCGSIEAFSVGKQPTRRLRSATKNPVPNGTGNGYVGPIGPGNLVRNIDNFGFGLKLCHSNMSTSRASKLLLDFGE